jgi:amino acid permease
MSNDEKFQQVVSSALESEREFELPHDFADRVVLKIQHHAVEKEAKRDKWWLIAGIVSMLGAFVFAFTKVEFKPGVGIYTFFQGYWGLTIFALIFILILHIVDKTILRKQESG